MKAHNNITLKFIMDTPMNRLKFTDFAFVKSGRDKWSSMKLDALQELMPPNDVQYLVRTFNGATQDITVALRWYQRGLTDVEKLVRLVKTKNEVALNAMSSNDNADYDIDRLKEKRGPYYEKDGHQIW